jgi:tail tube GTA-gp10-like protein
MAAKKQAAAAASSEAPPPEPAVDFRGQVSLPLDGQDLMLRPSFEAIAAIEHQLRPLFDLAQDATRGQLTLEEMGVIAAECMRAYGRAYPEDPLITVYRGASSEKLSRLIYEAGGPKTCARIMVLLVGALNGGYTAEGEAKAPASKT